jgi:hypothetical protein
MPSSACPASVVDLAVEVTGAVRGGEGVPGAQQRGDVPALVRVWVLARELPGEDTPAAGTNTMLLAKANNDAKVKRGHAT